MPKAIPACLLTRRNWWLQRVEAKPQETPALGPPRKKNQTNLINTEDFGKCWVIVSGFQREGSRQRAGPLKNTKKHELPCAEQEKKLKAIKTHRRICAGVSVTLLDMLSFLLFHSQCQGHHWKCRFCATSAANSA